MFDYFFCVEDEIPDGTGFGLFSIEHFCVLALIAAVIVLLCYFFSRSDEGRRTLILKVIAIMLAAMEIIKISTLAATGHMSVGYLPLHFCSFAIYTDLIIAFLPRQNKFCAFLGEVDFVALMPGALSALITPDWYFYPLMNFMSIHSFVWHMLAITFPIMLFIDRRFTPRLCHMWMPILYIAVITPFIALFDVIFKCNYFFIIWPVSGSILETYYYALGTPGWRFAYAATVFAVILTIYGLIELCQSVLRKISLHK